MVLLRIIKFTADQAVIDSSLIQRSYKQQSAAPLVPAAMLYDD